MASVSSSVSTTSYTKYDATGKLLENSQTTDGLAVCSGSSAACLMTYKYNLAGALTEETYPSGRVVHHNYAPDGKLATVSSRAGANRPFKAYAQNFSYNAAGAVTGMQLGNMRWENTSFNNRLQPTQIALGTVPGATDMLDLDYSYGTTSNNGNVLSQTISVQSVGTTPGFVATQSYTYDDLNRLKSATESSTPTNGSSAPSWKQTYLYDRFGNRTFDTSGGNTTTLPPNFNAHIFNPTINPANNQFNTDQDYAYDPAGNVVEEATGKKFNYDGENKQTSFGNGGSLTDGGTYLYDGDGKRVKKVVGSEVTIFVYDVTGHMVAEHSTTAPANPQVCFLTTDNLGTPRICTGASGTAIVRHDYLPFGEEIAAIGNRSTSLAYGSDYIRQKFTSKERDNETGLDYFGARYYMSTQGRFASVDPVYVTNRRIFDPQRLNLYIYARNSPLIFLDPNGLDLVLAAQTEEQAKKRFGQWQLGLKKSDRAHSHLIVGDGKNGFAKGEFGISVDSNFKSESGNFQKWQKIANDKQRTEMTMVGPNEDIGSKVQISQQDGDKIVLRSWKDFAQKEFGSDSNQSFMLKTEEGGGLTLFPVTDPNHLVPNLTYSTSKNIEIYIASDGSDADVVANQAHEGSHVFVSDMGRALPKGLGHDKPGVGTTIDQAEKEARENAKTP